MYTSPGTLPRGDPSQGAGVAAAGAARGDPSPLPRSPPRRHREGEGEPGTEAPLWMSSYVPRCCTLPRVGIPPKDRASRIRS